MKKWIFELKYKSKQIWSKEIEKFKSNLIVDKYIYISKSWFVESLKELYKNEKDICLVSLS